jgi:glucosamine--fructose-6-phosphate aminotransferase (isomerizing)
MCGIVGYIGSREAEPILVGGLSRLEYRGYDSAGIATIDGGAAKIVRAEGKLVNLRARLAESPCPGSVGIGHTRWATHGRPSEDNAHPHTSDGVTVVHNGIIENHREIREQLAAKGRSFYSDTDTELFAHLIALERPNHESLLDTLRAALTGVRGAYAVAVLDEQDPSEIAFAKLASPLVVGVAADEAFLASDVAAVLEHTRRFLFLHDGDYGVVRRGAVEIVDADGEPVEREIKEVNWSPVMAEKGGHKHFMHKEIFEQPRAVTDTLRGRLAFDEGRVALDDVDVSRLEEVSRVVIVACGTSWHAGLVGKFLIEKLARVPVEVDLASEFRYRSPVLDENTLVLAISQSGETADTLAAVQEAGRLGAMRMAICNVIESAIPRACDESLGTLYTRAGPEIGVASTKAFVTQLVALHLVALALAQSRSAVDVETLASEMEALATAPLLMESMLDHEQSIRSLARQYKDCRDMLYLGRGLLFPIALEGALKLKEISYIHAEGYAAGEMKHGPIALIDEEMPVVVLALPGPGYEKVASNLEEVRSRGGKIIVVSSPRDERLTDLADGVMTVPDCADHIQPLLAVIPLQIFSYHVADLRGTDVDQPRNLAKSVTVE